MFNDASKAKDYMIQNRKSDAISAYITESYFEEHYLNNVTHTKGWYIDCNSESLTFYVVKQELSELDVKLANDLNVVLWQVFYKDDGIRLRKFDEDESIDIQDFVKANNLAPKMQHRRGNVLKDEFERREKYCKNLIDNQSIINVANTTYIEDAFLNKYFMVSDIDFIINNKLGYLVFDVKFKYPSKNGSYGINIGPFSVYKRLEEYNKLIRVYNVVLKNPNKLDCIDYLEQEDGQIVEYSFIDTSLEYIAKSSPPKCAYFENGTQMYYEIPAKQYRILSTYGNIIDMRCPICGSSLVKRESSHGPFLGCSQYYTNGCKVVVLY